MEATRPIDGSPVNIRSVIVALMILPLVSSTLACSTESRHRIIVYDQAWSSAASPKNVGCAPELRKSCDEEAEMQELAFSKRLPEAFRSSPQCGTVRLVGVPGDNVDLQELDQRLSNNPGHEYWRLRVDFHPGLRQQPFTLGSGKDKPRIGGDDAEASADYICEVVKKNGVMDIW